MWLNIELARTRPGPLDAQNLDSQPNMSSTANEADMNASGTAQAPASFFLNGSSAFAIVAVVAAVLMAVAIVVRRRHLHQQQLDEPWRAPLQPNQWRYSAGVQTVAADWPSARYCEDTWDAEGVDYDASLVV